MATEIRGHCLCGQVTYSYHSDSHELKTVICNCDGCQRLGGSPYSLLTPAKKNDLKVSGPIKAYIATANSGNKPIKHFCSECGSNIYREPASGDTVYVLGGTINLEDKAKLQSPFVECFTSRKLPFVSLSAPTSFTHNP